MNIIDNRGSNSVKFSEIKVGDCFEYDGLIYLRTNVFYGGPFARNTYNVINLNNNCFYFFSNVTNVCKLNATLSIDCNMEEW